MTAVNHSASAENRCENWICHGRKTNHSSLVPWRTAAAFSMTDASAGEGNYIAVELAPVVAGIGNRVAAASSRAAVVACSWELPADAVRLRGCSRHWHRILGEDCPSQWDPVRRRCGEPPRSCACRTSEETRSGSHTAVAAAAYSRSPAAHTHTQEQAADNWTVAGCIEAAADTPNRSAGSAQRRNRRRSRQRTNSSKRRCASPCEWFECSWFLIVLNFQCSSRRIFAR